MAGMTGGIGSLARGRSFRTGYRAGSGAISSAKTWSDSSDFLENNEAFAAIKGNDDALWAFRNARNSTEAMQVMRNRIQSRGEVADEQQLAEQAALIMRAKNQTGQKAGNLAAIRAQAKTGTGYEDSAQMYRDIVGATGGDMAMSGKALAEMSGSAVQSGRGDLGLGSFNAKYQAMNNLANSDAGGNYYSDDQANSDTLDSVIASPGASQALAHGKKAAAEAIASHHAKHINNLMESLNTGKQVKIGGEMRQATGRDVKQAFAVANAVHDQLRAAGGENAIVGANTLMGASVNVDNLTPQAKQALGPAWERQFSGQQSPGPSEGLTFRQVMNGFHGQDQTYDEIRQDFANQMQAAQAAQMQTSQQQANPGGGPTQPPSAGPPTPSAP